MEKRRLYMDYSATTPVKQELYKSTEELMAEQNAAKDAIKKAV